MESIKDKIAIIGMGCTRFGENWSQDGADMVIDAVYEAYRDAGLGPSDIQAAWVGTLRSGLSGTLLADSLKLKSIPITRVENQCTTGHEALRNACFGVASGMYDIALAVGFEKLKDTGFPGMGVGRPPHPVWQQHWTSPSAFAYIAVRYFKDFGLSPEQGKRIIGQIAVKNHRNGAQVPKAHLRREVTLEQVLAAPIISSPLGLFDCCGTSDGAAAAIICRGDMARSFREDPIYIKGIGLAVDSMMPFFRPGFDYLGFEASRSAARQAYEQAGITDPRRELDLAEVHDCFTITELVNYEDLGLSPRGRAWQDVEAGTFTLEGELPVNTDGGLKCFGHPVGASGIRMAYEVYKQLQGKAELAQRQVRNPRLGLTHTLGGPPQVSCVAILGNEKG